MRLDAMSTKNPRVSITLDVTTAKLLSKLAKQKRRSVSSIAKEFILDALERREDIYFSVLADIRDDEKTRRVAHKEAWEIS